MFEKLSIKDTAMLLFGLISLIITGLIVYVVVVEPEHIDKVKDLIIYVLGTLSALLVPKKQDTQNMKVPNG